ncbi:unnamed protein product, partial [Rotaria magnacalcarata]
KDLYGQRHIAYFDPSCTFEHVEPIEQCENEDAKTRFPISNHQIKNGRDSTVRIKFELPPPPPIDDTLEEHIYEDIPNIIPTQDISTTTFAQQQSNSITDNDFSVTEQSQIISSSLNSLDEALHNVEQWSDIIVDSDLYVASPSSRISNLIPSVDDYVDEQYIKTQLDISSVNILNISVTDKSMDEIADHMYQDIHGEPNEIEDRSTLIIQSSTMTNRMIVDENLVNRNIIDCVKSRKSFEKKILPEVLYDKLHSVEIPNQTNENTMLVSTDLSTTIDQVIERIHVDDELIEAKKTLIIGIQAPSEILSSTNNI